MSTASDVDKFLKDLKAKLNVFDLLYLDKRGKNQQALLDLNIPPSRRREIIESLEIEDYSEGPVDEEMYQMPPMWIFGKQVNKIEVYIKISLGNENNKVICISFHPSEYPMNYPLKQNN